MTTIMIIIITTLSKNYSL